MSVAVSYLQFLPMTLAQFLEEDGKGFAGRLAYISDQDSLFIVNNAGTAIAVAGGGGSGITSLEGLIAASQTFGDDTNILIVSGGSVHQITWAGLLAVARGGTGAGSLASGAYLKGAGTSPIVTQAVPIPVADGGTGLVSGVSGGILGFTAAGVLASSAALTANRLVLGGGAGATPTVLGAGTVTTVLHGNAAGAPSFGAVALATDVSGTLPVANGGTGQTSTAAGYVKGGSVFSIQATPIPVADGGTGAGAITQGRVIFAGASGVYTGDGALTWDNTGKILAPNLVSVVGAPSISFSPTSNPSPTTLGSLVMQVATASASRVFAGHFGLTTTGTTADKVALYAAIDAVSGAAPVWALNTVTTQESASGSYDSYGYELDIDNFNAARGNTDGAAGIASPASWGLRITSASTQNNTAAIGIDISTGAGKWNRGIAVWNDGISSTGSSFQDTCTGHDKSIDIRGTPVWGVYQFSTTPNNHFAGKVRVGANAVATPLGTLDVTPAANQHLLFRGPQTLANGASVFSVNDANNAIQGFELAGSIIYLNTGGAGFIQLSGSLEGAEQSAPAAPPANGFRMFAEDNGAGKTRLMVLFNTGAAQQIAIQP